MVDDLRTGELDGEIPPHGTLGVERQHIPDDRGVGAVHPDDVTSGPAWIPTEQGRAGRMTATTYDYIPGFYIGDRPKVVTSRFEYEDCYTLERYLATDGYEGLKRCLR